jgi:hypothetical protein
VLFLQLGGLRQEPVQHLASVHASVALQLRKAEEVACSAASVSRQICGTQSNESSFNVENDCCESIGHGCQAQPALEAKCACLYAFRGPERNAPEQESVGAPWTVLKSSSSRWTRHVCSCSARKCCWAFS